MSLTATELQANNSNLHNAKQHKTAPKLGCSRKHGKGALQSKLALGRWSGGSSKVKENYHMTQRTELRC